MKKVLKGIGIVLVGVYLVVAITLTVFLLNYNKYNITELNNKSLIIVRDEELKPDFQKGDLVIVNKDANKDNNALENLEWATPAENKAHAKENNLNSSKTIYGFNGVEIIDSIQVNKNRKSIGLPGLIHNSKIRKDLKIKKSKQNLKNT